MYTNESSTKFDKNGGGYSGFYCKYYTKNILKNISQAIKRMVGNEKHVNIYGIDNFV